MNIEIMKMKRMDIINKEENDHKHLYFIYDKNEK